MFDLVADVERYGEFVPLCEKQVIVSRGKSGETVVLMTDMTVVYQIFRETFRSRVTLDRANGRILVESVDSPLCRLQALWTFGSKADEGCDVGFDLSYEFTSPVLGLLLGSIFHAVFGQFVQAFTNRADAIYGNRKRRSYQQKLKTLRTIELPMIDAGGPHADTHLCPCVTAHRCLHTRLELHSSPR
jgi:coenzyme Q-binding protein COQ10